MANDTKERILAAALEMFSQKGYAGTNIRELSASLGLVKSGVYKHYESKEAIWNALLDEKMIPKCWPLLIADFCPDSPVRP
jgi:AcrR family transcriptional regulator